MLDPKAATLWSGGNSHSVLMDVKNDKTTPEDNFESFFTKLITPMMDPIFCIHKRSKNLYSHNALNTYA